MVGYNDNQGMGKYSRHLSIRPSYCLTFLLIATLVKDLSALAQGVLISG